MKVSFLFALLSFISSYVNAGLITYTDRTSFQNDTGSQIFFEGFNYIGHGSRNLDESGYVPKVGVSAAGGFERFYFAPVVTEGAGSLGLIETSTATFSFFSPTYAFGFDVIDLNRLAIDYADDTGHFIANAITFNPGAQFFGVVSDTLITSFTLGSGNDDGGSIYFIDAFEARGVPVSEPGAMLYFYLVAVTLTLISRRKAIALTMHYSR